MMAGMTMIMMVVVDDDHGGRHDDDHDGRHDDDQGWAGHGPAMKRLTSLPLAGDD